MLSRVAPDNAPAEGVQSFTRYESKFLTFAVRSPERTPPRAKCPALVHVPVPWLVETVEDIRETGCAADKLAAVVGNARRLLVSFVPWTNPPGGDQPGGGCHRNPRCAAHPCR